MESTEAPANSGHGAPPEPSGLAAQDHATAQAYSSNLASSSRDGINAMSASTPFPSKHKAIPIDVDDSSSIGSSDAFSTAKVNVRSALSSPRSSMSSTGAARRGAWRAVGGGNVTRSYAQAYRASSDLSPTSSIDGHDSSRTWGVGPDGAAADTALYAADGVAGTPSVVPERQSAADDKARQQDLMSPGTIRFLPAETHPALPIAKTESRRKRSEVAEGSSGSAFGVSSASFGMDDEEEDEDEGDDDNVTTPSTTGPYDWANFIFAYSRGRWNPSAAPQPPSQSTIISGAKVSITTKPATPPATADPAPLQQTRRPSLDYTLPKGDTSAGDAAGASKAPNALMPAIESQSLPVDMILTDGAIAAPATPPPISDRVAESLPDRSDSMPAAVLAVQMESASLPDSFSTLRNTSSSASAVLQVPPSKGMDRSKSISAGSGPDPSRAQTAPSGLLFGGRGPPEALKSSVRPDHSVWETRKARDDLALAKTVEAMGPESDTKTPVASPQAVTLKAAVGSAQRPPLATQISDLALSATELVSGAVSTTPTRSDESGSSRLNNVEDPTTPTRPLPTPVQPANYDSPTSWQSAPDVRSGLSEALANQTSTPNGSADASYAIDLSSEHGTVAGLRRAARRTSVERAERSTVERKARHDGGKGSHVSHSMSFPGTSPDSTGSQNKEVEPLNHPPKLSDVSSPSVSSGLNDGSSVVNVAHFVEGKPTGETRIDLRGNPVSPTHGKAGSPGQNAQGRRQREALSRMWTRPTLTSSTSQRIQAYLNAGRKAEEFYRDHGYLPAILPPDEDLRLHALARYGPPKIAGDPNFERIAHLVKLVFNTKTVLISLLGEKEQTFQSQRTGGESSSSQEISGSRDTSFCTHAILQDGDEPMVVLDATKDWRFAGNPLVRGRANIRFYAGCPLQTADGQNIGSLCLIDDKPRTQFGPRQRHTLKEFARVVMREMELLRDRIQLSMRDRMQRSIELFTKECLEMDSEEVENESVASPNATAGMHKIFHQAAESMREALQVSGAVIFDLSHFELIDSYESDFIPSDLGAGTSSKIYFSNPLQSTLSADKPPEVQNAGEDDKDGAIPIPQRTAAGPDGTAGLGAPSPLVSPRTEESIKGKFVAPMSVLGASELVPAPPERNESVPLSHHIKVAEFLRVYKTGRCYAYAPPPFRSLLPAGVTSLLLVPIFGLNKQPFALLCAYSTLSEGGPALEELHGSGLQYIRAIGMTVLGAVLKKDIMLADKAKSHFISNISHELRTPLHGILAAAELLTETKLNSTQSSYLDTVEACGKSLLELVNHVLDFTKLSGNSRQGQKHVYTKTKCDMVKLIQEVCESSWIGQMAKQLESAQSGIGSVYAPPMESGGGHSKTGSISGVQAKAKHAQKSQVETVIDVSMRRNGWLVNCDTGGIRRVLMNLIGNSLKFTSTGYVHVSLREVQSSATHVLVELGVTDTGRGISRAFLEEQLFHPFTQENPLGTGTGLGLSIVNSIVQSPALNGKIDVWSTEGQGTEIRVTCELEICDDDDAEGPIYKPVTRVEGKRSVALLGFSNARGDEDLRAALEGYFGNWWEFTIVPQDSADRPTCGDLVLINDDLDLIAEVKSAMKDNLPPIIFLTGGRGDSDIAAACEDYHAAGGIARILFKPSGPSKLESVVDFCLQCLDRKQAGHPLSMEDTKPSTPLPSPSASPAPRGSMEQSDSYFVTKHSRPEPTVVPSHTFGSSETVRGELTPRPEALASIDEGRPSLASSTSYHMSPGPPGSSASLIRRHSTEDRVVRSRMEGDDNSSKAGAPSNLSRPLLPARSITYHEPRLHKHVLMSPLSAAGSPRRDGELDSYFDRIPSPSSPNTPGSTVSLEGGDGAVLKSVLGSSRSTSGNQRKRLQILSVEDNAINRKVIAAFLAKMDVDFVEACDGEEGVKQFESHPANHFDVILMDLSMPVLDGIAAIAQIRKIEADRYSGGSGSRLGQMDGAAKSGGRDGSSSSTITSTSNNMNASKGARHASAKLPARARAKIFALTGRSTDEDKRKAFQTGADGYIVKPLSFKVLSSLLRMLAR